MDVDLKLFKHKNNLKRLEGNEVQRMFILLILFW